MRKFLFGVVLTVFVLSACGTPATTPPIPTNTPVPIPTETSLPPTATLEPSPTPTPIPVGGGGKIFMEVNQLLIPKEFDSSKEFDSWFSASSDGSNLTQFSSEITDIYSISPDGKRMLANINGTIALINADGTGATKLDTAPDIYVSNSYEIINNVIIPYTKSVLWLSNGDLVFLASEKPYEAKRSVYVVNQDGSQLRKLEKPSSNIGNFASLLFVSPDEKDVYWVTGSSCTDRGICDEKYFVSKLDDSDQQQPWSEIRNASDNIYLSPSGLYLAYGAYFGQSNEKNGCYLATLAGETLAKIEVDGGSYCYRGNPWSPIEDKILVESWSGEGENAKKHYSVWIAPDGTVTTFSEFNAIDCYGANWTPDGKSLFLAVCTEKSYFFSAGWEKSLGQRIIDVSNGKVTEYPDFGLCDFVFSPNATWVLLYACTNKENLIVYPSQLLNLDTKEAFPVFEGFISSDPDAWGNGWIVFLTP